MRIKAKDNQIKQLMVNLVNVSGPLGLGILHYEDKNYTKDDIEIEYNKSLNLREIYLDYFHGRAVKAYIYEADKKQNIWELKFPPVKTGLTWSFKFPEEKDLVRSVDGIEILDEE